MATGSGKTFTSISFIYRLIKFAGARRVLFLAYQKLQAGKVRGAAANHILTDLVSLVRFAVTMHQENELVPFPEKV